MALLHACQIMLWDFVMLIRFFPAGGSFALYSLICRHVKINTIPNQHPTDQALTTYRRHHVDAKPLASRIKKWLENNLYSQRLLVLLVLFGTSMLIGDGILTPAISGMLHQSILGRLRLSKPAYFRNLSRTFDFLLQILIQYCQYSLCYWCCWLTDLLYLLITLPPSPSLYPVHACQWTRSFHRAYNCRLPI